MTQKTRVEKTSHPFNYAIWLYDMNADDVFDHERHIIVDSSLGLVEEEGKPDEKWHDGVPSPDKRH